MPDARINLIVIRVPDIEKAVRFYKCLGLSFKKEQHGKGPMHYASETGGLVLEIYPAGSDEIPVPAIRLGFTVKSLREVIAALQESGTEIHLTPQDSESGNRLVLSDPAGIRIELTERTG